MGRCCYCREDTDGRPEWVLVGLQQRPVCGFCWIKYDTQSNFVERIER